MSAVAGEADPARGAGRARLRQVWSGDGRIDRPGDVAAVLSEVRRAATDRSVTSEALTLVERGSEMARSGTLDPRHALPVPAELEHALGGLRRGSVVAASGSSSLLLSLIGAAHSAGAWTAIMGTRHFGATAAPEFAVDLQRVEAGRFRGSCWFSRRNSPSLATSRWTCVRVRARCGCLVRGAVTAVLRLRRRCWTSS